MTNNVIIIIIPLLYDHHHHHYHDYHCYVAVISTGRCSLQIFRRPRLDGDRCDVVVLPTLDRRLGVLRLRHLPGEHRRVGDPVVAVRLHYCCYGLARGAVGGKVLPTAGRQRWTIDEASPRGCLLGARQQRRDPRLASALDLLREPDVLLPDLQRPARPDRFLRPGRLLPHDGDAARLGDADPEGMRLRRRAARRPRRLVRDRLLRRILQGSHRPAGGSHDGRRRLQDRGPSALFRSGSGLVKYTA